MNPLRQTFKQKRAHLAAPIVSICSRQMCTKIARSQLFKNSQHIGIYYAVKGEIDPAPLIALARQHHKTIYLPVIHLLENRLEFRHFGENTRLRRNKFGIPEPIRSRRATLVQELDLVLAPLLAFTADGVRMGMGKGYYDRTFAHRNRPGTARKPFLLGCGYEWQRVDSLTLQPWDVKMDAVVTEKMWYGRRR